jgi:hypothetical protein
MLLSYNLYLANHDAVTRVRRSAVVVVEEAAVAEEVAPRVVQPLDAVVAQDLEAVPLQESLASVKVRGRNASAKRQSARAWAKLTSRNRTMRSSRPRLLWP